jgi:hypothetical protein
MQELLGDDGIVLILQVLRSFDKPKERPGI